MKLRCIEPITAYAASMCKGKHTITMKYDSASFATGKMLTIIGLVLCGGGFVVTMVMDKKKKS